MKEYRADLHIHTLLSPCASLEMSPAAIVDYALAKGIKILAITDHNHTAHGMLTLRWPGRSALAGARRLTAPQCFLFHACRLQANGRPVSTFPPAARGEPMGC